MIEIGGLQLRTLIQGGTFAALGLLAIAPRAWIEGKVAAAPEIADRFKAWRTEVRELKGEVM